MSESETDIEFVSDMEWLHSHDREAALPPEKLIRLFALARRGAETAAEIERLKAEVSALNHAEVKLLVQVDEQDAEIERLRAALGALGVIGGGYCFCSHNRDPEKENHQPECREARAALKEDGDA